MLIKTKSKFVVGLQALFYVPVSAAFSQVSVTSRNGSKFLQFDFDSQGYDKRLTAMYKKIKSEERK
jgi:hypothetical protein